MPRPKISRPAFVVIGPSIAYVPLTCGFFSLIDLESVAKVSERTWQSRRRKGNIYASHGYTFEQKSKDVPMHRFLMDFPDGRFVDHINRNTLDNRLCNLRACTHEQNNQNRIGWRKSKHPKGVYQSRYGTWIASISVERKLVYLGSFKTQELALEAYEKRAKDVRGEFYCPQPNG